MDLYKDLIGVKYKDNGRSKEEGFDCYGLAIEVLRRNGLTLDDRITNPSETKIPAVKLDTPENLCVVLFKNQKNIYYHLAVYIGNGLIIHTDKKQVCIEPLARFNAKYKEFYRVH